MKASAPGKVLWSGEYAVLHGHAGVISAVDRRVVATLGPPGPLSPFLDAVREELGDEEVRRVRVDSSALSEGGAKLGLGSSAAATVAAVAAILGAGDLARVHAVAHRAHARAQAPRGARGSGADIAASVHGGLLRVRKGGDEAPLLVERLAAEPPPFCLLWTGTPADTPSLVAQVQAMDESERARCMDAIGAASDRLAAALTSGQTKAAVAAVAEGAEALAELAGRCRAPLVPPQFAAVQTLAGRYQGAVKPTGAGGGDLLLCVFATDAARDAFRDAARARGILSVETRIDGQGVLAEDAG